MKKWKTVGLACLGLAVIIGGASLISNAVNNSKEDGLVEIHPDFKRGSLNNLGKYVVSNESIYTPDAFECYGLEIELDFERNITFEVFYYDEYGSYLSSSSSQNTNYIASVPLDATHARIEITPDWSLINVEDEEDRKVKWYEVNSYANQMTIKVAKDQKNEIVKATFTDGVSTPSDFDPYVECSSRMTWEDYFEVNERVTNDDSGYINCGGGYLTHMDGAITYNNKLVKSTDYVQNGTYLITGISIEQWLAENQ